MNKILLFIILLCYINLNAQTSKQPDRGSFKQEGSLGFYSSFKDDEISPALFLKLDFNYYSMQVNFPVTIIKHDYYNNNRTSMSYYSAISVISMMVGAMLGESKTVDTDSKLGSLIIFSFLAPMALNTQHHFNFYSVRSDSVKVFNLSLFAGPQFDTYAPETKDPMDNWSRFGINTGIEISGSLVGNPRNKSLQYIPSLAIQGGFSKYWDINDNARNHSISPYICVKLFLH